MCPPNLPLTDEFRKSFKKYSKALYVQLSFEKQGKVFKTKSRGYRLWLHKIIHELESKALSLDYPLAAGLIGGPCKLCRKCIGPAGLYKHPSMARTSIV
jgi:predicted metal-binding protein